MTEVTGVRVDKLYRGIAIVFSTKGEPITLKVSAKVGRDLMKGLFRCISPDWGGSREGSGRKDGEGE